MVRWTPSQYSLMEGKRKSALKIESSVQVIGTEGSTPKHSVVRDICQRDDPSGPLLSGSHHLTACQVSEWGPPGGQLDKPCVHRH